LIGRRKLDVSDNDKSNEGRLTVDEVKGLGMDSADVVDLSVDDPAPAPEEDSPVISHEETAGVISAVLVTSVLN
jgi:hypothetical protein